MKVRSFKGRTMAEALEVVKNNMGDKALVIETRDIKEGGVFGKKVGVEVVAAIDSPETKRIEERNAYETISRQDIAQANIDSYESKVSPWNAIDIPNQYNNGYEHAPASSRKETIDSLYEGEDVSTELASIRRQLARLTSGETTPNKNLGELFDLLQDMELPDDCIAELDESIGKAKGKLPDKKYGAFASLVLERALNFKGAIDWDFCKQLLVVGPTGVGKTTTIAKIAGELALQRKRRIALITIDTYRVGAAEQLQAYADLLAVPFEVAHTPEDLERALKRFASYDNVLIDTAGRNPSDTAKVNELRDFIKVSPSMQVALSITATSGKAEFASAVERFSVLPIEHTIITKLDECVAYGRLYGCLRRHHLPLSFITTGQEVPDDIKIADKEQIISPMFQKLLEEHRA